MKTVYPDYVKAFRPKGTVVRLRNGRYLAFSAKLKKGPREKLSRSCRGGLCGLIDCRPSEMDRQQVHDPLPEQVRRHGGFDIRDGKSEKKD
ncbi:MAG: hypothetical protein IJ194_04050 [Bacilli bacterium]|nr:hypothetical protein [Bacilli bacterium]